MNGAWLYLCTVVLVTIGGYLTAEAIRDFKKEHYFMFGVELMMVVLVCAHLFAFATILWAT